jgi:hypothetical protein
MMKLWPRAVLLFVLGFLQLRQPATAARIQPIVAQHYGRSRQLSSLAINTSGIPLADPANTSEGAGGPAVADSEAAQMGPGVGDVIDTESTGLLSYDLDQLTDLHALLQAHQDAQNTALQSAERLHAPRAIKVETHDSVGLGNRIPSIVTGFVMALFTKQAFLLESSILQHVQLPLTAQWSKYDALYQQASRCSINNITTLLNADSSLCSPELAWHAPVLMVYNSIDYDMPFLQVNPAFQQLFSKYFPDGEVFHSIASYLLSSVTPTVQAALDSYTSTAEECLVGMHMRTKKHAASVGLQPVQLARIAKALAQSHAGNIFIAADQVDVFAAMSGLLPRRDVWWSNLTYTSVATSTTTGGNPGTEISAIVDLLLLSKCQHIVVTPASSFGAVAAGLAGVAPVYATYGTHKHPFLNTWFWRSVTSEPCCFKLSKNHNLDARLTDVVQQAHPLYYYHNQCHP